MPGRVGESALRADGAAKVSGRFAYASDLRCDGMLWGATVRSPVAHARIGSIDVTGAWTVPGVVTVMLAADLPARPRFGLNFDDQPVLADGEVQYAGEPVALVAAETPGAAREAARRIRIAWQPLRALTDMEDALRPDAVQLRDFGNVLRHVHLVHGDPDAPADVWVEGYYETGMQDQAPLGPECTLAIPAADGGLDVHAVSQWLHVDREQIAPCVGLDEELVRVHLAGVGGAFGSREDIHTQIHASVLALRTGRPVKIEYGREESFHGHVHRHPARMWVRHGATSAGDLVAVHARLLMDGGAYASSSPAVLGNAATFAAGPYAVPNVTVEGTLVYTNNPPCGAMRGFGAPQVCFAYEAQMDKLARALAMDPVDLRRRNALQHGSTTATGQRITGSAPVREIIDRCVAIPLPPAPPPGRTRGIGFAIGFKNVAFSEGYDDAATAKVTLSWSPDGPVAEIHTAAVEMGQGLNTFLAQVVRTELGVERVDMHPTDTLVGNAGSTSASRQSMMSGGAVQLACRQVRAAIAARAEDLGVPPDRLDVVLNEPVSETAVYHHRRTEPFDEAGQGDVHVAFAFAAERAVVDVDEELGLVEVVQVAAAIDVGTVLNPIGLTGQIEGGTAQGLGLAVMEEIQLRDGAIVNPSFTDYLIPTALDVPPIISAVVEDPEPGSPYGLKGMGESPTVVATAAVVAAVRDATGRELNRAPVTPDDLTGLRGPATTSGPAPIPDVPGQWPVPVYHDQTSTQQSLM